MSISRTTEQKPPLSKREQQVLRYASRGLTDKEIARQLGIRTATVLTYWIRIRNKLGGHNRAEVVASSIRLWAEEARLGDQAEILRLRAELAACRQAEDRLRAKLDGVDGT